MKYVREKDIHKNVSRVISGFVISDNFFTFVNFFVFRMV